MSPAFFRIPLNVPHAATLATRIQFHLGKKDDLAPARELAGQLARLIAPYRESGENPGPGEADRVVTEAARLARAIVDEIERAKSGHDRLGQAVRNLFECLELGEEGAAISLRAGENPKSALRPT